MTPEESLLSAIRDQAVKDVSNTRDDRGYRLTGRWETKGKSRQRVQCGDHDAARCALDYLKALRAVRIAAAVEDWDARQVTDAYFAVVRR